MVITPATPVRLANVRTRKQRIKVLLYEVPLNVAPFTRNHHVATPSADQTWGGSLTKPHCCLIASNLQHSLGDDAHLKGVIAIRPGNNRDKPLRAQSWSTTFLQATPARAPLTSLWKLVEYNPASSYFVGITLQKGQQSPRRFVR